MGILTYDSQHFLMDGQPFTILSGAVHYFRVPAPYWEDRLRKLKACGFNTVETYVAWNQHEKREGSYDFSGMLDLAAFIRCAQSLGLYVILRPGPYICAEFDFGGLPSWLLADPSIRLRCQNEPFLQKVRAFFQALFAQVRPLLCTNGGPVIAVQLENEYGSFGDDKAYLASVEQILKDAGADCLLFTSDGPTDSMLTSGTLPHILKTANFGSRAAESFPVLERHQPHAPLMCCEYWNGWFDHWGEEHHTRDADDAAQCFDDMLSMGASVNFYMFHGGTNFGFTSGANHYEHYAPTVTSYDYDSPLTEAGDLTPKYEAVKRVIEKHFGPVPALEVSNTPKKAYGAVSLCESAGLLENLSLLSAPVQTACPETMEALGQAEGFLLYHTVLTGPLDEHPLVLQEVHDRATVYVNGVFRGVICRQENTVLGKSDEILISAREGETLSLDILVENMGHVNYGPYMPFDQKGVTQGIRLGLRFVFGFTCYPLPLSDLSNLPFAETRPRTAGLPVFLRGRFHVSERADSFLRLDGFHKGVVWINGFNLGRYWEIGPQKTLYLPAPLLKEGENELTVLELHDGGQQTVSLQDTPLL